MNCPRCGGYCDRLPYLVDMSKRYGRKILKFPAYQCVDCLGKYLIDGTVVIENAQQLHT